MKMKQRARQKKATKAEEIVDEAVAMGREVKDEASSKKKLKNNSVPTKGSISEEENVVAQQQIKSSPGSSPKKKKGKQKKAVENPPPSPIPGPSSATGTKLRKNSILRKISLARSPKIIKTENELKAQLEGMKIVTAMSANDLEEFLGRLESQAQPNDVKKVQDRERLIDWKKVAFSSYGPEHCKSAWLYLKSQTRKFRIMRELVDEVKGYLKIDYKKFMRKVVESSPEFPEKPYAIGAFGLFCRESFDRHRDEKLRVNDKADSFFDRESHKEWNSKTEDEKKDYENRVSLLVAEHKRKVKEFYAKYPLFAPKAAIQNQDAKKGKPMSLKKLKEISKEKHIDAPPLPLGPFKLFINAKLNRQEPPPSQDELLDLKQHYIDKWKSMSDTKKLKWIEKCVRRCERFVQNVKEYKKNNPDYMLPVDFQVSKLLSKEEFKIWASANGNPPNPKHTVFDVFLDEFSGTEEGLAMESPEEVRKAAMTKFEGLDWYHKEMYKMQFQIQKVTYKTRLLEYFTNLPVILRKIALDCVHKVHRRILQDEVNKDPLVFDDEQPEAVVTGKPNEPVKKRKRQEVGDGDETESQVEPDEFVEDDSPKKKKKKKKRHTEDDEEKADSDAKTVTNVPLYRTELTEEQKRLIREVANEGNDKDGEPKPKKKKKAKKAVSDNEDEAASEGEDTGSISKKKKKGKMAVSDKEDDDDASSGGKEDTQSIAKKKIGGGSNSMSTSKKPSIARNYEPGKIITTRFINEAIRGIFDGQQFKGRRFSVYYFYAKYVSNKKVWDSMINRYGLVETARRMIETFHRLDYHQKEIFVDQAFDFYKQRYYGSQIFTREDMYVPNLTYFPDEPKEPPSNAISLYMNEMDQKCRFNPDLEAAPWDELDEKIQMYYMKKLYKITREYVQEYEEFVKNMAPNDMVEYLVIKNGQWEKKLHSVQRVDSQPKELRLEKAIPIAARDYVVPFSRSTYAADLSDDDGNESEAILYETEDLQKQKSGKSFRYKKNSNPMTDSTGYIINPFKKGRKKKLYRRTSKNEEDYDSDVPSSSDEDDFETSGSSRSFTARKLKRKVKKMATYYYPLEDLYERRTARKECAMVLEEAKKQFLERSKKVIWETQLTRKKSSSELRLLFKAMRKRQNTATTRTGVANDARMKSVRKSLTTLRPKSRNCTNKLQSALRCPSCDFIAATKKDLCYHQKSHENNEDKFNCPKCTFMTESREVLAQHHQVEHKTEPFKCYKCYFTTTMSRLFRYHMMDHFGIFQFRCGTGKCLFVHNNPQDFKQHLETKGHKRAPGSGFISGVNENGKKIYIRRDRKRRTKIDQTAEDVDKSESFKGDKWAPGSGFISEKIPKRSYKSNKRNLKINDKKGKIKLKRKYAKRATEKDQSKKEVDPSESITENVLVSESHPSLKLVTSSFVSPPKKKSSVHCIVSTTSDAMPTDVASTDDNLAEDSVLLGEGLDVSADEADLLATAIHFSDNDILEAESSLN